jgi:hypothetical protein
MPDDTEVTMAKAKEKKTRTETEYQELKDATTALARCVNATLQTRGKIGVGTGMVFDHKTKKVEHWSVQFFDAMDLIGIKYDREAFFAPKKRKR